MKFLDKFRGVLIICYTGSIFSSKKTVVLSDSETILTISIARNLYSPAVHIIYYL